MWIESDVDGKSVAMSWNFLERQGVRLDATGVAIVTRLQRLAILVLGRRLAHSGAAGEECSEDYTAGFIVECVPTITGIGRIKSDSCSGRTPEVVDRVSSGSCRPRDSRAAGRSSTSALVMPPSARTKPPPDPQFQRSVSAPRTIAAKTATTPFSQT